MYTHRILLLFSWLRSYSAVFLLAFHSSVLSIWTAARSISRSTVHGRGVPGGWLQGGSDPGSRCTVPSAVPAPARDVQPRRTPAQRSAHHGRLPRTTQCYPSPSTTATPALPTPAPALTAIQHSVCCYNKEHHCDACLADTCTSIDSNSTFSVPQCLPCRHLHQH